MIFIPTLSLVKHISSNEVINPPDDISCPDRILSSIIKSCIKLNELLNFLESLIPFNPSNITFEDVRGNIPTRLEKLLNGDCQGLIVAKAAIDRLISYGNKDISAKIQSYLDDLLWMIIPLSLNPCAPGQGAIAIEVNSKRKDIIELVNKINHNETFSQVVKEICASSHPP